MQRNDIAARCETCPYFIEELGQDHGTCVVEAPKASLIMQQSIQGAQPAVMPYWPPVKPEQVCARHPSFNAAKFYQLVSDNEGRN